MNNFALPLGALALAVASFAFYQTTRPVSATDSAGSVIADYLRSNPDVIAGIVSDSDVIRDYLMENPEVIMDAVQRLEEKKAAEAAKNDLRIVSDNAEALFNDGYSLISGNPEGDVTVVEFSDYNCGFCKRAHNEMEKFVKADGNVRVILKEFPILGPGSVVAARAALAVAEVAPEKQVAFSDALITHRGSHTEATVMTVAKRTGIDADALKLAMESEEIDKSIRATHALAEKLRITGTPAFIIGDEVIRGYVPADTLAGYAKRAREAG